MPRYRVFYLKEELSHRFRESPATSVRRQLKPKDYVPVAEIEAPNDYAAWQAMQSDVADRPLGVGDVLEPEGSPPRLCLFGGFEETSWWTPEPAAAAPPNQPPDSPSDQPVETPAPPPAPQPEDTPQRDNEPLETPSRQAPD